MWRKKKKPIPNDQPDKVASRVASGLWQLQRRWAQFMSRLEARLPFRKQKWMVILFALCLSSYSFYLIIDSFTGQHRSPFTVQSIRRPAYVTQPGPEERFTDVKISVQEQSKINRFIRYMDSLQHSVTGKATYDSIVRTRPGLMDSIQQLQKLFQP